MELEYLVSVFCIHQKTHVKMTLEKSVRDTLKNHNSADYGVNASVYNSDKKMKDLIHQTMKRCEYVPILRNGKMLESSGAYWFKKVLGS